MPPAMIRNFEKLLSLTSFNDLEKQIKIGKFRASAKDGEWECNRVLHEIHGYEHFGSKSHQDYLDILMGLKDEVSNYFFSSIKNKTTYRRIDHITRPIDKEDRWTLVTGNVITDTYGEPIELNGCVIDITSNVKQAKARQHYQISNLHEMSLVHSGATIYCDL